METSPSASKGVRTLAVAAPAPASAQPKPQAKKRHPAKSILAGNVEQDRVVGQRSLHSRDTRFFARVYRWHSGGTGNMHYVSDRVCEDAAPARSAIEESCLHGDCRLRENDG